MFLQKEKQRKQKVPDASCDLDKEWEEILDGLDYDFLPIEYINVIIVRFRDGKVWEVDVNNKQKLEGEPNEIIANFFEEYEDTIDTVDFRIDTTKLKKDVTKRTKRFLKLNK